MSLQYFNNKTCTHIYDKVIHIYTTNVIHIYTTVYIENQGEIDFTSCYAFLVFSPVECSEMRVNDIECLAQVTSKTQFASQIPSYSQSLIYNRGIP